MIEFIKKFDLPNKKFMEIKSVIYGFSRAFWTQNMIVMNSRFAIKVKTITAIVRGDKQNDIVTLSKKMLSWI